MRLKRLSVIRLAHALAQGALAALPLRTPRHKAIASSITPAKGRANTMVAVCTAATLPALVLVLVLLIVLGTVFGSF